MWNDELRKTEEQEGYLTPFTFCTLFPSVLFCAYFGLRCCSWEIGGEQAPVCTHRQITHCIEQPDLPFNGAGAQIPQVETALVQAVAPVGTRMFLLMKLGPSGLIFDHINGTQVI